MALPIEDYGLIGDLRGAALVGRDGSIDWLCLPRFDSPACFAALVGEPSHGRWLLAPASDNGVTSLRTRRRYRPHTLVLETEFATPTGRVRICDCMSMREGRHDVVRVVEGIEGRVAMTMELVIRFDYGSVVPWVRRANGGLLALAGPAALYVRAPVPLHGEDFSTVARFEVHAGTRLPFVLSWCVSHEAPPVPIDGLAVLDETAAWWEAWSERCCKPADWRNAALPSLIVLKALTYSPTGGIVAAPTTSLPEQPGGARNWDYRYCWLRDATFTLYAFLSAGYTAEAVAWREWLLRAAAGRPSDLQILYSIDGARHLLERELPWLPGYQGARPVRIGNAASTQLQLDVFGEVMDVLHVTRASEIDASPFAWALQCALLEHLESAWREPDHSIWEMRTAPRHFTHSKVMAWVAADRAVKAVERFGLDGPLDRWRALRDTIHREVCERGFDATRNAFVQHYGSNQLDASLLMVPLVGFLPPHDARVRGTVHAIERELTRDGFVQRYDPHAVDDGFAPGEGAFLPCSFWLVDNLVLQGRRGDAQALFNRLCECANDLGLFAEEFDLATGRLLGNFPQAFTHVGHVNSLCGLAQQRGPSERRSRGQGRPVSQRDAPAHIDREHTAHRLPPARLAFARGVLPR